MRMKSKSFHSDNTTPHQTSRRLLILTTILLHIVTYVLRGRGGILWNSYVTADAQLKKPKDAYLVYLVRYGIIKRKRLAKILCVQCLKCCSNQKFANLLFLQPAWGATKNKNPSYNVG